MKKPFSSKIPLTKLQIISLLVTVMFLFSFATVSAERLKGKGVQALYRYITFDPKASTEISCDNGLVVEFTGLRVANNMTSAVNGHNQYWYKAGILGVPYVLGVQGINIKLTNTTDKVMVIKWSESSLTLGNFSGIPFLPGMKYANAGNPAATPDTIIPPKKSIHSVLYISQVSFSGGSWQQGYAYVRVDKSLKAGLYMKALDPQGMSIYCVAESPAIILPEAALKGITVEKY